MQRRSFIQLSAFTAATISLPFLQACNSLNHEQALIHPVFLSRLFDENKMLHAGEAYMQKMPEENNKNKLVELIAGNNFLSSAGDEKTIYEYLDKKVKNDFEKGNTVLIQGWVLAVTEARQCALFSLLKK